MRPTRFLAVQAIALTGALLTASSASACGSRFVFDEDQFLARTHVVVTETFDQPHDFPVDQKTVKFRHIRFTSTDTAPPYWAVDGGELYRRFSEGPDEHVDLVIDFGENTWARGLGFRLDPFGFPNRFEITVTRADGRTSSKLLPADVGEIYVGIRDWRGIESVSITQRTDLTGGVYGNFAVDDVSRTALLTVPDGKRDCKHGGWRFHLRDDGSRFHNQGSCVRYVVTGH